jgi:hypothetical protein
MDAEALDCLHRIALALESMSRHLFQINEMIQDAVEAQAEEE